MPTPEDLAAFKTSHKTKQLKNFNDAEKYMLMIISIPEFGTRLQCWKFTQDFNESVSAFVSPVKALKEAVTAVRESKHFKIILGFILAIGNYMNGGTAKGQADGFNLKCLPKLDMTKDKTNKVTLIQYICSTCYQKHPETSELVSELKPIHTAKDVQLEKIEKELENIKGTFSIFKSDVQKVKKVVDQSDPFIKIMTNFYNDAQKIIAETENNLQAAKLEYTELLKFYAYKQREIESTDPSEFFGNLSAFMDKFEKSLHQLKKEQSKNPTTATKSKAVGQKISNLGKGEDAMTAMVNKIKSELAAKK